MTFQNAIQRADNFLVEYFVPFKKEAFANGAYEISGVAINTTVTRNNVKYTAEELEVAAQTLIGRPILKDHEQKVDSIVGVIEDAKFEDGAVVFKGKIMDEKIKEMVEDGRIKNVSIGAQVKELVKENKKDEGEIVTAKGITFLELSLVAVPGDANAVIFQAHSAKPLLAVAERFDAKLKEVYAKMKHVREEDGALPPAGAPAQPEPKLEDILKAIAALGAKLDSLSKPQEEFDADKKPDEDEKKKEEEAEDEKDKKKEERARLAVKEELSGLKRLIEEQLKKGKALAVREASSDESGLQFVREYENGGLTIWAKPDRHGFYKV